MLSVLSRIQFVKNCTYRNRKIGTNHETFLLSLSLSLSGTQILNGTSKSSLPLETKEITGLALNLLTSKNHSNTLSLSLSLSLSSTLPPLKKPMKAMDTLLEATTMHVLSFLSLPSKLKQE